MVYVSRQPNNTLRETGLSGLACLRVRRDLTVERSRQEASLRKGYTGLFVVMPAIPGTDVQDINHARIRSGERRGALM
jgi:hypothetical protein